eukprot:CAMPEP_0204119744 /NCGR_PEP_ID=MMETSP0361-20130328/7280_1 /ASSEMBLY_ACC=CAM_ASM_000343 /TAXON_ID=268821 /ORGANISM="Scrippsiella Hangoei, Strain SHTV-5" /LENGTH=106 /DNA_ID=CAMNT_0051070915 /DNA_START=121 /DNA_END=439 /DNA_ORIENTATION=-
MATSPAERKIKIVMFETTVTDEFKTTQHHHHYGAGTSCVGFDGPVVKLHAAAEWMKRSQHPLHGQPATPVDIPGRGSVGLAADHHAGGIGKQILADFAAALRRTCT